MGAAEDLPPRWRDNMRERRACLFRYRSDESLTASEAGAVAEELIADNGEGRWHYRVVQLDERGRDWEFRFKPRLANVVRYPGNPRR